MVKKLVCLVVAFIIFFSLTACDSNYNAVMYDNAKIWMQEEFLKENMTFGAHSEYEDGYASEANPKDRTFIIQGQDHFNGIFIEFPAEIDYEKEMLLLYIFTTIHAGRQCKIKSINLTGETLKIDFIQEPPSGCTVSGDVSMPLQRCIAVKMDKLYINSVVFELLNPRG